MHKRTIASLLAVVAVLLGLNLVKATAVAQRVEGVPSTMQANAW